MTMHACTRCDFFQDSVAPFMCEMGKTTSRKKRCELFEEEQALEPIDSNIGKPTWDYKSFADIIKKLKETARSSGVPQITQVHQPTQLDGTMMRGIPVGELYMVDSVTHNRYGGSALEATIRPGSLAAEIQEFTHRIYRGLNVHDRGIYEVPVDEVSTSALQAVADGLDLHNLRNPPPYVDPPDYAGLETRIAAGLDQIGHEMTREQIVDRINQVLAEPVPT